MNSDIRDWTYRHYVANSLMMIPENKRYTTTLYEILKPDQTENRSAEEITRDVIKKTGIKIIDNPTINE